MAENFELQQELDCELMHIIVQVPKDTVSISITAKLLQDGKLVDAHMSMSAEEFRHARRDFLDNVDGGDDYDNLYALTDEGKAYVDKLFGGDS